MAQLKDTTVSGSLRATDTIYSTTIQAQILKAPTASNGATYGPGTNGQVLKSNGTSVYWGTDNDSVTGVKGSSESSYRTGQVSISASNIGLGNVENTALSTWTGSANIKTVGTITSGTWNGTTIGVGSGGTGLNSLTQYAVYYASTSSAFSAVTVNTTATRKFLRMVGTGSAGAAPAWDTVTKTDVGLSNVTNDAQIAKSVLSGVYDMLYSSAANTPARLAANTSETRKFLRMVGTGSAGTAPEWDTVTKTDVGLSNVTNDAQVKASLGTTKGDMVYWTGSASPTRLAIGTAGYTLQATANGPAWTQKVAVANGGTGATSVTKYGIAYGNSSVNAYAFTSAGSDGYILIGKGSNDAPTWQQTLPANHGGTGYNSYTIGDILYASSSSALSTLGGNTTTTRKFLTSTGASSAAQAPAWNILDKNDIPAELNATTFNTSVTIKDSSSNKTVITHNSINASNSSNNAVALTIQGNDGALTIGNGNITIGTGSITISTSTANPVSSHTLYGDYTLPTAGGFQYTGIESDTTTNKSLPIWFMSDTTATGVPVYNTNFGYNPSSKILIINVATLKSDPKNVANTPGYDTLTLGNETNVSSANAHSEGQIYLYSAATQAHIIKGTSTTSAYTHTLPNDTGVLVSLSGGTAKGSTTKPIYVPNTGIVTECDTYAGGTAVTLNGSSKAASTASFYAPTSSGTANDILASGGANATPTWITPASGALYATSNNGAASFGTLPAAQGGTGQSTYTVGDILYCGTANTLSKLGGNTTTTRKFLRSVATTSGTAVAPAWDTVTKTDVGLGNVTNDAQVKASLGTTKGDMLYWSASATPARLAIGTTGYFLKATADGPVWANTTDITALGTITTGTWNGSKIDVSYLSSSTTNRLVWSQNTGTFIAGNHYASGTQISIASTTAPDNDYVLKVNGNSQHIGAIYIKSGGIVNSIYSQTGNGNIGRIYQWFRSSGNTNGNISHSQWVFQEWSYNSTTPSNNPLSYYEQYLLPDCDANLSANKDYNIITEKNLTDITKVGTITAGTWNGSKIDVSYLSSSTPNRLVWSQSTGTLVAGYHYVSGTQMSIGTTGAPDTGYTLKVNGALEAAGVINIITNTLTKDLYFSNGTPGSCGVVGRIMYNIGTGPNITKSYMCFVENSYSSTASATPIVYGEYYYLPACTAGLTQNLSYNILTTKSTVTVDQGGTGATTALKAFEALSCRGVPSSITTLDDIKGAGYYWVNTSNIANGWPSDISGTQYALLEVVASNAYAAGVSNGIAIQRLNMYSSTASYSRLWANGQWYSWETSFSSTSLPNPLRSRQVPSNATFDSLTTAGVYDVINNITGTYPATSGTGYTYPKYGTLVVFTTHRGSNGTAGNITLQLYYANSPQASEKQRLYVRVKYASNWKKWHEVTLTQLSV